MKLEVFMTKKAILLNFIIVTTGLTSTAIADSGFIPRPLVDTRCVSLANTVYEVCIFNACNALTQCRNFEECSNAFLFCVAELPKCEDQKVEDLKQCKPEVDIAPRPKPIPDPMFS